MGGKLYSRRVHFLRKLPIARLYDFGFEFFHHQAAANLSWKANEIVTFLQNIQT